MCLMQFLPEGVDLLFFNIMGCNVRRQVLHKHLSVEVQGVGGKCASRKTWGTFIWMFIEAYLL